ncbi:MAG: hypothetical protein ACI9SP_004808 [Arenicella sp.]|jgi:hypothetical protein
MKPFPKEYELESFFECEPSILDKDVPWGYNQLTFRSESSNGSLKVLMEPGYETMHLSWMQGSETVLELNLKGVLGLEIKNEAKLDTMIVSFRSNDVTDLVIKNRPLISVYWGYNDQL